MIVSLNTKEKKLYQDCVNVYGVEAQLDPFAEECLEAALAVRKYFRAKKYGTEEDIITARKELFGEIVDVSNMSIQMQKSFVPNEDFLTLWNYKIQRQIGRIEKRLNTKLPSDHE
jgi:hypothetical protein